MKRRTIHVRTAAKLLVAGAVAGGMIGTGIALAAPSHADPLSDPNVHCLSQTFALYCDGPIRPDGTFTRQWTTSGGSYYAGPGQMGFIPGTTNYQTVNINEPWPIFPLGAPQWHIEQNGNRL